MGVVGGTKRRQTVSTPLSSKLLSPSCLGHVCLCVHIWNVLFRSFSKNKVAFCVGRMRGDQRSLCLHLPSCSLLWQGTPLWAASCLAGGAKHNAQICFWFWNCCFAQIWFKKKSIAKSKNWPFCPLWNMPEAWALVKFHYCTNALIFLKRCVWIGRHLGTSPQWISGVWNVRRMGKY